MAFNSCFDIIGPVMVGPSSSHTAGVVSIGLYAYDRLPGVPDQAEISFYGSFAETYRGHGTDKAVVGGLLGMSTDNTRIKDALKIAREWYGVELRFTLDKECPFSNHPNTLLIQAYKRGKKLEVGGVSLGGGVSKIVQLNQSTVDILLNADRAGKYEGGV